METNTELFVSSSPTAVPFPGNDICHFFNTPGGCFKGSSCRFRHVHYAEAFGYVQPPLFYLPQPPTVYDENAPAYGSGYVSPPPYFEPVVKEEEDQFSEEGDETQPNEELVGWLHYYSDAPVPEEGYGITEAQLYAMMMNHTAAVHQYYQLHQKN